ncbi:hypothetical protein BGY98DRAFT_963919 [Russula aff. rugulosa BPL654]|nr:hypothetical protein BGY98DRAFT_963919 [Russula aff. rugulosa BPL654]
MRLCVLSLPLYVYIYRTCSAVQTARDSDSRTIPADKRVVIRSDRYLNVRIIIYTNGIRETLELEKCEKSQTNPASTGTTKTITTDSEAAPRHCRMSRILSPLTPWSDAGDSLVLET